MREFELIEKRKSREKHFLQEDGTIIAKMYNEDIHYLKDGMYEEIDNSFIEKDDCYINKSNKYKVSFKKKAKDGLMNLEIDNHYLKFNLRESNKIKNAQLKSRSKVRSRIEFDDILEDVSFDYEVTNSKIKESIILKKKCDISKIIFDVDTDLILEISKDNSIIARDNDDVKFVIEAPYMIDSNNKISNNIFYELCEVIDDGKKYELILKLDKDWLSDNDTKYPVLIDPTIIVNNNSGGVYDTYIYPGDTNVNRNSQDILKVGVERVDGVDVVNRALIKFDLPEIGTGSQVIDANLNLFAYPGFVVLTNYNTRYITIHNVTSNWTEESANWSNMNDKFESRVINWLHGIRTEYSNTEIYPQNVNITEIVKKWYADIPNYGLMLKDNEEVYANEEVVAFYSKNNNYLIDSNPSPLLEIHYRNQNGLESYMNYDEMIFVGGAHYVNQYNGNLVTCFNVGNTIAGKFPVNLNLFYNTNDVVLNNNIGYGLGYRLSLHQTIKEITIDEQQYLEYVDEDGTIHYFSSSKTILNQETNEEEVLSSENTYYDEDGLDMIIEKYVDYYVLSDKVGNSMKFIISNEVGLLSEINDVSGNKITISYNTNDLVSKVVDANNQEINLIYETNKISVISPSQTTTINYSNNKIISIESYLGTVSFTYNSNNCLSTILDISGKKLSYEYYEQTPYRLKKVIEYGLNNTQGTSVEYKYSFNATTVIDHKGLANTMVFNNYGNVTSVSNLKGQEEIIDAYGTDITYGEMFQEKNKLSSVQLPIKYVKNYILDSSFENNINDFVDGEGIVSSITSEFARTGANSLKIVNDCVAETTKTVNVRRGKYYTFSAYFKNGYDLRLELGYDSNGLYSGSEQKFINCSDDFMRHDVTIYYPESDTHEFGELYIKIICEKAATIYMDDMQLEEGEVANEYNLLDNTDFSNGLTGYSTYISDTTTGAELTDINAFEVVTLSSGKNALKINMNPKYQTTLTKTFDIVGKTGDVYNISFWYKNKGLPSPTSDGMGEKSNNIMIYYNYIDQQEGEQLFPSHPLSQNETEWQFFTYSFLAQKDFSQIEIVAWQLGNANELYITNLSLYKDVRFIDYTYDANGNIISAKGLDDEVDVFKYDKNNQLIQMLNPKGKNFKFEYDNVITNRLLKGISATGISNEIIYDTFGNPITTRIINNSQDGIIEDGLYQVRLKGTKLYLRLDGSAISTTNDNHGHNEWLFEVIDDYYKISHSIIANKFITNIDNSLTLGEYQDDKSLFKLIQKENGSYLIKSKVSDYYLKNNNNILVLAELVEDDYNFEFYLENSLDLFIENNATYTDDGRFIKTIVDSNLNEINYEIDEVTGLVKSIIDAKGSITNYTYNDKRQVSMVTNNDMVVNYSYNSNNLLSKIIQGNREYNFIYDDFHNSKQVKIGENITLITNHYQENNGNLLNRVYGNNHVINYGYDEFNRLNKVVKMDNTYHYKYDSKGNIAKIIDNNNLSRYYYDLANRINRYKYNYFDINYTYDNNGNIISKDYKFLDKFQLLINNTYNEDDAIIKTNIGSDEYNYNYDKLGRLVNRNINNQFNTEYDYITNGNRTTLLVKSIKNEDDQYSYKYDKLGNITNIYYNDELINEYKYDNYNQLISENNYLNNKTVRYQYDNYGNILSKKIYEINTYNLLNEDVYEYNNTNWQDQLTRFNDDVITYDEIGNPLTIGNKTLTWKNGRELNSYSDGSNVITYAYNHEGIRTKKIVNDLEVEYYLEGNKIILEKKDNFIIQYKYNDIDDLIGFRYYADETNETIFTDYYYIKNIQNDIIGILDNSYNIVGRYVYDSFGNIISITDGNDNDVSGSSNHIANINPFRYRSYYYDVETEWYYLNSRYYNPTWGRFLNIDDISRLNKVSIGFSAYNYCGNNPISRIDIDGYSWWPIISAGVGVLFDVIVQLISNAITGEELTTGLLGAIVNGFTTGILMGAGVPFGGAVYAGAFVESVTNNIIEQSKSDTKKNIAEISVIVFGETTLNGTLDYVGGKVIDKLLPKVRGRLPETFSASILGKHAINNYTGGLLGGVCGVITNITIPDVETTNPSSSTSNINKYDSIGRYSNVFNKYKIKKYGF